MTRAFKVGSLAQDAITGLKAASVYISATARYMSFEFPVATDYQVPAGKTFIITKILYASTAANSRMQIGTGTAAVADGAAAPAGYVALTTLFFAHVDTTEYASDVYIPIAENLYPCAYSAANDAHIRIFGVEV
jgi:hypothetical protein